MNLPGSASSRDSVRAAASDPAPRVGRGAQSAQTALNPLWVVLFGLETPAWWSVAGALLILVGLLLRYLIAERRAVKAENLPEPGAFVPPNHTH